MIDIEDLAQQLLTSPLFKTALREQVRQCSQQLREEGQPQPDTTLPDLVRQISSQLAEITQIALQEDNSHNYISFMNKNQQFCEALERKIQLSMQDKVHSLNAKINIITQQLAETSRNIKKSTQTHETQRLREERKAITQNILDKSKMQTKSTIQPRQHPDKLQNTSSLLQPHEQNQTNDTRSRDPSRQYSGSQEEDSFLDSRHNATIKRTLNQLTTQQKALEDSLRDLSDKLESKIQSNLQGLWNVLSDLATRIAKFQSLQPVMQFSPQ